MDYRLHISCPENSSHAYYKNTFLLPLHVDRILETNKIDFYQRVITEKLFSMI